MQAKERFPAPVLVNNINIICLVLCMGFVLFYPVKKQIWYDESVSVLCSKGLYYTDGNALTALPGNTSAALAAYNNPAEVFHCTIVDNGNSFLYNELLHFFTAIVGNELSAYVLFSRLCAAGVLLAIFFLCRALWGNSLFTGLSLILLLADGVFWNMSHEVRGYELGMMLISFTALFFYKYMYQGDKTYHLLFTGLFAVGTVLSHYLSAYAILVMIAYILINKRANLFSIKNIAAITLPVAIIGTYFVLAAKGFATMDKQNTSILARKASEGFSLAKVALLSMKFTSYNFKFLFPAFKAVNAVFVISFILVIGLYIMAVRLATTRPQKRNLHLLFLLGISSTVFLAALSVKSHHYTALYFRYYSFCIPFATLFTCYALYVVSRSTGINVVLKGAILALVIVPTVAFFGSNLAEKSKVKFNHIEIAKKITSGAVEKITVPDWTDAFLVQSFLPKGYKLEYIIDKNSTDFTLTRKDGVEKIPLIRINS